MRMLLTTIAVGLAALAGHLTTFGTRTTVAEPVAAEPAQSAAVTAASSGNLVMHEWGTFTSFSGSNGVPVHFLPDNTDLPPFVYHHSGDPFTKSDRLVRLGTVSMETPVMYFYSDREVQASIRVDFPKGWITEWYPHAATAPDEHEKKQTKFGNPEGETIRWDVKLLPNGPARFPQEQGENPYYHARETDAVPLQTGFDVAEPQPNQLLRGGSVTQREKFLFYRGVGTFAPPVTVRGEGGGKVTVTNAAGGLVSGMVLVVVRNGQVGFQALPDLEAGAKAIANLPEATASSSTELGAAMEKALIAAGLYEREARAMVKTWDHAWFREEGARLLYLVPRTRTDELLPAAVTPKPTEVVRVIVGRHDFLTPEQEAIAERQAARIQKAQAELAAAEAELGKLGRFSNQAREMAAARLEAKEKK